MIKKLALTFFLVSLMSISVFANEQYIVKLKESEVSLFNKTEMDYVSENIYTTTKDNATELLQSGMAEYIEPDAKLELYDVLPDDTYYGQQVYFQKMKIPQLQKNHTANIRIAVIDSGINKNHPDLFGANILKGYNYVENNNDVTDEIGHGTRVAGVLAATPNNGIGIAGVAPDCTIVPLVCVTKEDGRISHLISAIEGAVYDYDCKVLNLSLGSDIYSQTLEGVVNKVANEGIIVVAAAGNDGGTENEFNLNYPAAFDSTISVGAITDDYKLATYSQKNDKVDVCAIFNSCYLTNNAGGYTYSAGTSFAAPVITGMVAHIISTYPEFNVLSIRDIIKGASVDVCESGRDYSGYGCLMGDEIDKIINYKHNVFISPYIDSNEINLKLFAPKNNENCILIKNIYKNGIFNKSEIQQVTFNQDNLFYYSTQKSDDETVKFFAWDSLDGQQSYSDVR